MNESTNGGGNTRLFLGCFISLIATAFGFVVRASILEEWRVQFDLTNEQAGYINGAGLYPFAISIILLSLFLDRLGYGRAMVFAFIGHVASALMTIFATSYEMLYAATFLFALANGTVEAVINPVVATLYTKNKTHWLNILHAGWPGGLILGGLLAIGFNFIDTATLPGGSENVWRWQMGLVLLPTLAYGILLLGQKFPVQERVAAGVSYLDMLKEFGWGSSFIVSFLLIAGLNQILIVAGVPSLDMWIVAAIAVIPTVIFGGIVKSFGRPMFVFLLLVMFLLATTELGTDSWIADIMRSILGSATKGTLFLVYTSVIMFVLRFFAGPIVHRISPLGLLMVSCALAVGGLVWLANAGSAVLVLFLAATLYGIGKTFFWPTTLGVVSEQYPKGGALMLNAIAGVGMLAVGTIGGPAIGTVQDMAFDQTLEAKYPALHEEVVKEQDGMFGQYFALDQSKRADLSEEQNQEIDQVVTETKQATLGKIAILPAIMFVCYGILLAWFRSRGGYKAEVLAGHAADDEQFTGGVEGPVE